MNFEQLKTKFDQALANRQIRMVISYDGGHAYNEWNGAIPQEEDADSPEAWEEFEEYMNEELSERDPGMVNIPPALNHLIRLDAGQHPGKNRVVADEDDWNDDVDVDTFSMLLGQFERYSSDPERNRARYRADLMELLISAVAASDERTSTIAREAMTDPSSREVLADLLEENGHMELVAEVRKDGKVVLHGLVHGADSVAALSTDD